ncbi:Leucine-rich repeat domain containing protein [Trichostrongylus colubriformis]|uniref:Leucine-rich repeat domain containing protein n=1 Tax=Trichostrongylus colubriformis TaxID=6319 RepID=A0AAN8FAX5_TRICO
MHFAPVLLVLYSLIYPIHTRIDHQDVKHLHKTATKSNHEAPDKHIDMIDIRKSYTELFKGKRRDQLGAIESIVNIEQSKRRRYVEEVIKNVKEILRENRETLERIGHRASEPYPHNSETLTNAISKVLENIAFFSDLSLRFPFLEKTMEKDRKLRTVIVWAYHYAKGTGLCDTDTYKVLDMMAQQHGIIPKTEKYDLFMFTDKMAELSLKELKDLADDNEIDLSARGLTAVPKALPQVPRLTHIDLGSNKITVLPSSLCTITRLVRLELGSNLLDHLPDNIGNLVHLEHLDLYNNQIEELPLSFSNLNALRWLDLKKNPLSPELLKVTGNCGSEKECRQAALNVVSYMKELHKVHNIQMMKQQKVNEKIQEVKETKEPTHKSKKKHHNKKDDAAHQAVKNNVPSKANNNAKFSQAREAKKEKEQPKSVRTNRGFFSRMIRFLIQLSFMSVVLAGLAATVGILLNCSDGGKGIPGSKPLCADLSKLAEFKRPSPRFFSNIQKTYGTVFNGYYARVQPTVLAAKKKWNDFHREFVKSDIGLVIDRYYHKIHAFVVDTFLKFVRFLQNQRVALEQWWERDGRDRLGGVVDTIHVTVSVVGEIIKDLLQLAFEALQAFYHRVEVFVSNWSARGLSKAIEAGF